jgi:type II secretory ATPase GspE/PulE/Tfp pilus assembly ATPase PilB-like protein
MSGIEKVSNGVTTTEEILRVTMATSRALTTQP